MSGQAQLHPGTLDLLILKAVSLGPLHGYGVLLRIGQISEQLGSNFIETLIQDVRFSIRVLRKSPGFTIVAVLALAIGANTVVFRVLNSLILRPLNVPQPESLYTIEHGSVKDGKESYPNYLDLRDRNSTFDSLVACNT
jgi:hypothetical protein